MPKRHYLLTLLAEKHLDEIAAYTVANWGERQRDIYLGELHEAAEFLAKNHKKFSKRHDLSGSTDLCVRPVKSHYLVYEPIGDHHIAIAAIIEQGGRPLPDILNEWSHQIQDGLGAIREMVRRGEFANLRPKGK